MTLWELADYLLKSGFPYDSPIAFTWETVVEPIEPDMIYLSQDGVVMIGYDYRDEFETGAMSARERGMIDKPA